MKKIILDLCGGTGSWSKPYKEAGYGVIVITWPHFDVRCMTSNDKEIIFVNLREGKDIHIKKSNVYGILAAPPCTEFSFAKTNSKYPRKIKEGMEIVEACLSIIWEVQYELPTPLAKRTTLKFWALENPFGLLRRYLGHPVLTFNPYDYGDGYQKKTCLWGFFNLPKRSPSKEINKEYTHTISPKGKPLKKFDKLASREIHPEMFEKLTRQERRAITPAGFAKSFFEANR